MARLVNRILAQERTRAMAKDLKRVGVLVGREWSFPPAFIEEVNSRNEGVIAEFVKIGGTKQDQPCPYDVIVDRISHEVPFYRSYLKNAVLQGTHVINNPFMWASDDKYFEGGLATKLGVAHPKTILLPNKDYIPGIVTESLRNLEYPLDWQAVADYTGMPAIFKDAHGGGWREVYKVESVEELLYQFNQSGTLQMILQEFIDWEQYVRCMVLDQEHVLVMPYNPKERRYVMDEGYLSPELEARIISDCRKLCRALGYDMNTVEFAVQDGIPYAIDFMNPAPDMDIYSLTPLYFDWVIKNMADMVIRKAHSSTDPRTDYRWYRYLPK